MLLFEQPYWASSLWQMMLSASQNAVMADMPLPARHTLLADDDNVLSGMQTTVLPTWRSPHIVRSGLLVQQEG